jgi:methylated-DNA-protein-cysteine methyltransferase related protein
MKNFKQKVYDLAALIPCGRVMSYGQIAALCGSPGAARVVGQVAHFGPPELPWHRVVNAKGGLAIGFVPGGRDGQARLLQAEKLVIKQGRVCNIGQVLWWPAN